MYQTFYTVFQLQSRFRRFREFLYGVCFIDNILILIYTREPKHFSKNTGKFSFLKIKSIVINVLLTCAMHWRPFGLPVDLACAGQNMQGGLL